MKRKKKVFREEVAVLEAAPEMGLTQAQAAQRKEKGWMNAAPVSAGKTEWDIIGENLFTFFEFSIISFLVGPFF